MALTLNLVVFINLFVLFCVFYFGKNNTLPNKILALILINPGINFISNIIILTGNFASFPYIFFLGQTTALLFAPLVHIYTNLLIGKRINKIHPMYILTSVAMLISIYFAIEYIIAMSPEAQSKYLYGLRHEPYPWQQDLINTVFIILQQIYFSLAAIEIYRYKKRVNDRLSSLDKIKIRYATRFIILIWLLNLITIGLYATLPMITVEYFALPSVLAFIYIFIIYYAFHYNSIFTPETYHQFLIDNTVVSEEFKNRCDIETPIKENELEITAKKIQSILETEEPFVNPDLTLDILADIVGIPCGKVSLAINKVLRKTFFDLINEHRVTKSKKILLEKHEKLTIQAIAEEAGFNSRASFYRAFKKYTQQTPVEYLKYKNTTPPSV
jgi:AraC-like DNA-binding protein